MTSYSVFVLYEASRLGLLLSCDEVTQAIFDPIQLASPWVFVKITQSRLLCLQSAHRHP